MVGLTSWDLSEAYAGIRRSLRSFHAAMYAGEVVLRLVVDREPHPRVFAALDECLTELSRAGLACAGPGRGSWGGREERALLGLQWASLVEAGYRPSLEGDGGRGGARAVEWFDPARGGVVQEPGPDARAFAGAWRVRAGTLEALRALDRGEEPGDGADRVGRATRLLAAYLRYVVGDALASEAGILGPASQRPGPGGPGEGRAGQAGRGRAGKGGEGGQPEAG